MTYRAFVLMTGSARGIEPWRLALGLLVTFLVMFGMGQALVAVAHAGLSQERFESFLQMIARADTPPGLLITLFSMGAMAIGAGFAARLVHDRDPMTLLGPWRLLWRQFVLVTIALLVLTVGVSLLPPWSLFSGLERGLSPGLWFALLPLTLTALLVQCASEEILFRGYLQSQLAARFGHPAVWLLLPTALFALGHWAPGVYGDNAWLVALWAMIFGLTAADITARAGTLGPAIALHLVNNVTAIAIAAPQGDMSGLALFQLPFNAADADSMRSYLPVDLLMLLLSWLSARIALRL